MLIKKRARMLRHRPDDRRQAPALSGSMNPEVLLAAFAEWRDETSHAEDAEVLKALEEEFAEARQTA